MTKILGLATKFGRTPLFVTEVEIFGGRYIGSRRRGLNYESKGSVVKIQEPNRESVRGPVFVDSTPGNLRSNKNCGDGDNRSS